MPVSLVSERFPVSIIENDSVLTQFLPIRSLFDGTERQLFAFNPAVERVVISCHGTGSNADAYALNGQEAAALAGASAETLVVAPQFAIPGDLIAPDVLAAEPSLLYWGGGRFWGRRSGNADAYPRAVQISSFTVMDALIGHLGESGLFPNLHTIIVVGQSGGGQFALRYAFASRYDPPEHIQIRYIPMNPGSVVYASPKRAVTEGNEVTFEVPDDARLAEVIAASSQPNQSVDTLRETYDRWGKGMQQLDRYDYLEDETPDAMIDRFRSRAVAYLIGANDNDPNASSLPRGPRNLIQGQHRLERSHLFELHLRDEGIWDDFYHVRRVVPGVGHNGRATMTSDLGLWYLFGYEKPSVPSFDVDLGELTLSDAAELLQSLSGRQPIARGATVGSRREIDRLSAPVAVHTKAQSLHGATRRKRSRDLELLTRGTAFAHRGQPG